MWRYIGGFLGVLALPIVLGCGSSATNNSGNPVGPGDPVRPGDTLTVGPVHVQAQQASGLDALPLGGSAVSLTAICGATITGLTEMGAGRIAFIRGSVGSERLWVMHADGSRQTPLLKSRRIRYASWSPQGDLLALVDCDPNPNHLAICHVATDTYDSVPMPNDIAYPDWSPDDPTVLLSMVHGPPGALRDLVVAEVGTPGYYHYLMTTGTVDEDYPSWSPDGRYVLYAGTRPSGLYDIFLRDADGSHRVPLTSDTDRTDQSNLVDPVMSPDGLRIAYTRLNRGPQGELDADGDLYVMNADGTSPVKLSQDPPGLNTDDRSPTWSADGRRIVFSRRIGAGTGGIWVMDAEGSNARMLTNGGDAEPDWCQAQSVNRVLVGPPTNPDEPDPPFGAATPLVVCGLGEDGLAAAAALDMEEAQWATLAVSAVQGLVGVRIEGEGIRALLEDRGWGKSARVWELPNSPPPGGYIVVFSGITGRVASVIVVNGSTAASARAGSEGSASRVGDRVVLRGTFSAVYTADGPTRNRLASVASKLTVDARTGKVLGDG